jgi:hypothetical protein
MRIVLRTLGLFSLLAFSPSLRADEPIPLSILYAGPSGTEREKEFTAFLERSFRKVDRVPLVSFTDEKADVHDVVIFDWDTVFPRDSNGKIIEPIRGLRGPKGAKVSESYDRPTVLIGAGGQMAIRNLRLKIDSCCICLGAFAHGIASEHEVFRSPFPVKLSLEDQPAPPQYPGLASGRPIGKSIKVWRVQTKDHPDVDWGLVSSPWDFDASPDAEVIASGINTKTPGSVALGRQGNFFLWGFSASPRDMTPEARKCFVNVVCYMKKFDHQRPIVHKTDQDFTREWALMVAHNLKVVFDEDAFVRSLPESVAHDPVRTKRLYQGSLRLVDRFFSEDVRKQCGTDAEKYIAWVRDNYEWIRPGAAASELPEIAVDQDAKALGLSTRKVESLDAWVKLLERKEQAEVALRLLKRYTGEAFDDAKDWRSWLDSNRDRLFFDEVGGYGFRVAPKGLTAPPRLPRTPLSALEPTHRKPVAAEADFEPKRARPGESVTFVVRIATAPGWHITAAKGSSGAEVATSLELKTPEGFEALGDWTLPVPTPASEGRLTYNGSFEFRRRLRVAGDARSGSTVTSCTLRFQACDAFSCRPPEQTMVQARLDVVER